MLGYSASILLNIVSIMWPDKIIIHLDMFVWQIVMHIQFLWSIFTLL